MTKKSEDINYISKDLFPKTYNRTMLDDDYIKQLEQENKELKEKLDCDLQWALKYEKQVGNWNKLKEWLEEKWEESRDIWFVKIINKMQELESSDSNE